MPTPAPAIPQRVLLELRELARRITRQERRRTVTPLLLFDPAGAAALVMPPGVILPYGGSSAPTGFLLCDGAAVSRDTYAALFAAIGVTFGPGDGLTTFNLPDMRTNVPVGYKAGDPDFGTLGDPVGAVEVAAAGSNAGTVIADHPATATGAESAQFNADPGGTPVAASPHTHNTPVLGHTVTTEPTFTGSPTSVVQPSLVVNYLVKT